jgi:heme/copper-type cytochrome/quinol oxidase subunit 1
MKKEKMTSEEVLVIVNAITAIAAIPVAIWSYKSAEDLVGAAAQFIVCEMIIFFITLFVLSGLVGYFQALAELDENTETESGWQNNVQV